MSPERAEVDALLDLRARVLAPEGGRSGARMGRDHAPGTRHWVVREDGSVIACASVMVLHGLVLRGMAVEPARQRQGLGRLLLLHIHEEVRAPLWCNARLAAVPFYVAAGWAPEGPAFDLAGAGLHQRMTWAPAP